MDQKKKKKEKIGKKIIETIFPFMSNQKANQQIIGPEEQIVKKVDPYMDLCQFEYIYSSMKSVSEGSIQIFSEWLKIMQADLIDLNKLSQLMINGINDECKALRGVTWRILLGYLTPSKKQWINRLETNKKNYIALVDEHILKTLRNTKQPAQNDHPLNRSKDSSYNNRFEDFNLWQTIENDTKRTRQKEGFFHIENQETSLFEDDQVAILKQKKIEIEYNYDVLTRILFIYTKLNGQYIQGMNELVAILYYSFVNDDSILLRSQAEVDTFFCFTILLSQFRYNFFSKDEASICNGFIQNKIRIVQEIIKKHDFRLYDHMLKIKIDPKLFMSKWFMTVFTKEFKLYDTVILWDHILCELDDKNELLNYVALAIIHWLREDLLKGEFGEVITILQNLENQKLKIIQIIETCLMYKKQFKLK
ncbi:unnamed protein product [Paramecium sonneborni]|uniref:Rab-GAP TBC domain-containing protein n=1 Tax=Paramecium sonneborni TaxID=65129 RepID=A0A8S1KQ19_9CILI|nr:unnamed protein product [Paramecium sonneborni]